MNKIFTTKFAKGLFLAAVATLGFTAQATAATWHAFNVQVVKAGEGKVYAEEKGKTALDDVTDWQDSYNLKYAQKAEQGNGSFYVYAQPADGWLFAGFRRAALYMGLIVPTGDFIAGNPAKVDVVSTLTDTDDNQKSDSTAAAALIPEEPNNYYQAVFTHVFGAPAKGFENYGTVTTTPIINNIGDEVTITAAPKEGTEHPNTKFAYWTLNGVQLATTDSVLTIIVNDTARYEAHFTSDDVMDLNFGEGAFKYIDPTDNYNIRIPEGYQILQFLADSLKTNRDDATQNIMNPRSLKRTIGAGDPAIVYGKGRVVFERSATSWGSPNKALLNKWSGEGLNTASLSTDSTYYLLNEAELTLDKVVGDIPANIIYIALPNSAWNGEMESNAAQSLTAAPEKIYLTNRSFVTTGIEGVETVKPVRGGIYTIDGMKVNSMKENGVYIFDGKKVIYQKK